MSVMCPSKGLSVHTRPSGENRFSQFPFPDRKAVHKSEIKFIPSFRLEIFTPAPLLHLGIADYAIAMDDATYLFIAWAQS